MELIINKITPSYNEVSLAGFSLGGNMLLKYLGEQGKSLQSNIKSAAVISAPLDLLKCSEYISFPKSKRIYNEHFLRSLRKKIHQKKIDYPQEINLDHLKHCKNIWDFDHYYTGPIHGFDGAEDYYTKCSSIHFIEGITVPTLILNSLDDPFLHPDSHPISFSKSSTNIHLYITNYGGHVGFTNGKLCLSEELILQHFQGLLEK